MFEQNDLDEKGRKLQHLSIPAGLKHSFCESVTSFEDSYNMESIFLNV